MKKSFFICLAAWLLFRTGAAEPVHSWDFNKEPLKPKLYGSELRDHALVCGEKHNNAATGFRNYFEAFTLELRFKPEEEFSKTNGGTLAAYAFSTYGRRYFCLRVTGDSKIEALFEIRDDKMPQKLLKLFTVTSDKVRLEPGKFYTVRIASRSGGDCRIWLDGMLIAEKKGSLSFSDFKGTSPTAYPLFTIGCAVRSARYENFFHGLIDDVKLYDSFEEPAPAADIPADAAPSKADPNLVLNGESTGPFLVPDRETELLGSFARADAGFIQSAASARLKLEAEELVVSITCPIPEGTKPLFNDKSIWGSDHIEFFVRPDSAKPSYFQYSAAFDGRFTAGKFNMSNVPASGFTTQAKCRVKLEPGQCRVTLNIPRKELGIGDVRDGQVFTGNLIRSGATSGGDTFWKNPGRNFHNPDGFGIMIAGSRKAYFESVVGELLKAPQKDAAVVKLAETVSSQIRKYGDSPEAWDTLQKNIQNLRMALMRSALAGKNSLIHAADLWNNHFAPSPNTLPLKELKLRAPLNVKVRGGFVFSNLSTRPYMGRIKFFTDVKNKRRFNQTNDSFASRWSFFEALPVEDSSQKMLYDALAPLTLNSIFRVAPGGSAPLFFEINTAGLKPGTYQGTLILKSSYSGFPEETVNVALTLENVDLGAVKADSFAYDYFLSATYPHCELVNFYDDLGCNIIYIGGTPGHRGMDIYPVIDAKGNVLKNDFSDLDKVLDLFLAKCGSLKERRLLFFLYTNANTGLLKKGNPRPRIFSDAWNKAMMQWTRDLAKHLSGKYQIPAENIILYPVDEPGGDVDDPKSSMHHALNVGRVLKKAGAGIRLMINPNVADEKLAGKNLPALAESYDIFEFYFPHLKPKTIQLAKQTGKELWSYYIPAKVTSPLAYRSMGIKNFQAGFSGVAAFWHLDSHAGGDGLNSYDTFPNSTNSADYGAAYLDYDFGSIMPSRRLWAWQMGMEDYRLAQFCREHAKDAAHQSELNEITAKTDDLDLLRERLLNLALKLSAH